MGYYSPMKKDKLESSIGKWMHLQTTMLNEMNQAHTFKYHMVPCTWETQDTNKEQNYRWMTGSADKDLLQK